LTGGVCWARGGEEALAPSSRKPYGHDQTPGDVAWLFPGFLVAGLRRGDPAQNPDCDNLMPTNKFGKNHTTSSGVCLVAIWIFRRIAAPQSGQ